MAESKFKVLIVGGSVAGLSLANMLERVGIDYLVLESYHQIAPQVGASIGLMPHGLRILDQLGCSDSLISLVDKPLRNSWTRHGDGSIIAHYSGIDELFEERHGYPIIFIDRQMLLQGLYDNLQSKDRVLTKKKVTKIETLESHVEVTTESGETFLGDMVIGADGVYSTVRSEMWRLAKKAAPTHFPADEWSTVPCDYKCIFGISSPLKTISEPGVHYTLNRGWSYLVITGPGGRIYWFLLKKLPQTTYGDGIPRFSKKDEEELAALHASDAVNTETTFGDIYAARTSSVLTPLHEHVFSKWYYNRITTVGDSAHKFEPISGHGGNSAIETAATLTNHLVAKLGKRNSLSANELEEIFAKVQSERFDRVSELVKISHRRQQNDALETPLYEAMAKILPQILPQEVGLQVPSGPFTGATKLEMLPVPYRARTIPFNDELPAKPLKSAWLPTSIGLAAQFGLYWLSGAALKPLSIPSQFIDSPLRKEYTGIQGVDGLLSALVSVFGAAISPSSPVSRTQIAYFMPIIAAASLDWTIEGNRRGNKGSLIAWPSIYSAIYQILGIGRIAPLYNIASTLTSTTTSSLSTAAGRDVAPEVSEALLPSVAAGFVLPTILMFNPLKNTQTWQKYVAFWQPSPVYVGLLTTGLAKYFASKETRATSETKQEKAISAKQRREKGADKLKQVYAVGFGAATLFHLYSMYQIWKSPELSVAKIFGQLINPFEPSNQSEGEGIFNFLKWDLFLSSTSMAIQGFYRIFELRKLGYITTSKALKAAALTSVGHFVVGPAATQIGLAGWKEHEVSKLIK